MIESTSLIWLFLSSLISSTLFPGGSEVSLGYLITKEEHSVLVLLLIATVGNTLGGLITYGMGYWVAGKYSADELVQKRGYTKAINWLHTYGVWALLLSWLPVIGDPLCFLAGWLKLSPWLSFLLILIGKLGRYTVIVALASL